MTASTESAAPAGDARQQAIEAQKAIPVVRSVKNMFFRRSRGCILSVPDEDGSLEVTYKNVALLRRFVSERGRIVPRRIANVSSKKQRELKREIKRARILALMPFVETK